MSQTTLLADTVAESRAGDILLLPLALAAFWTVAYQLVLITRWPAHMVVWCFFAITLIGLLFLWRLWSKTNAAPERRYRFHPSHLFLFALGVACSAITLFVRRPNQDDVVYFHRALTQLSALEQPIILYQTSVDMKAAAFSPLHLATSYEMLTALLGRYLGIDPLYFYQVVAPAFAVFLIPFVLYWCTRSMGLKRWPAAIGALFGIVFLLLDALPPAGFGNTAFGRMWQGKAVVWILLLPVALCLSYRYLRRPNYSDLLWLTLLLIAGVGLSNTALYLLPAVIGCSCVSFFVLQFLDRSKRQMFGKQISGYALLAIPLAYPIAMLALLKLNVIPQPIDTTAFGPKFIPWQQPLNNVLGLFPEYLRDIVIMVGVPLLIVRGKNGVFLFFYFCAVWLLCLNPLLAHWWMKNIIAACYFRLVYLVQLPLLCAMSGAVLQRVTEWRSSSSGNRILSSATFVALILTFVYSYRTLSIMPRNPRRGVGWKKPAEYQLLPANTEFAKAAGLYLAHSKLLAPGWTASCELPLLFPTMKITAPRFVTHYFANVNNRDEGVLRSQAQAFVEGNNSGNAQQIQQLESQFRQVVQTGRATAVAASQPESARVLIALQSIDPGWHRVLEAGGLVLMLPGDVAR